ncbi:acetate--CoA ligase [Alphaproteobacteria bacterium]|nr:acetate--CoA ligase [Alphaproteobacteria bacterium]MDB3974128.1 acetate--CoA ligase [Alphaproteobacteria bacterium]
MKEFKLKDPLLSQAEYEQMYQQSFADKESFWSKIANEQLTWFKNFSQVKNTSFEGDVAIKWFEDGELNVCYNCVDRHAEKTPDEIAIIWEGDDPSKSKTFTYKELKLEVSKFANVLKKMGVQKGDRVTIYLTMIPEVAFAMLACARIGAIHSVIFGGFAPESIAGRIQDCKSQFVITADEGLRGGKTIPLKKYINTALESCDDNIKTLVIKYTNSKEDIYTDKDFDYAELKKEVDKNCECESMNAEDPLFILYTSGSTGKPKGVLHTTGGYLVYASFTHKYSFDYHQGDVYWCTADAGWVTGHSYSVYGPLANGAKTLLFEGVPNYPDFSRFWQVCDKHQVNIFYTAPTAIRALMKEGDDFVKKCDLSSLRILGTVGEPINPEAWNWYASIVGKNKCPVIDTWWQTETGGHLISPIPGISKLKPGSAAHPYFGIEAAIVDDNGNILEGECEGKLCMLDSWPGQMRTVYGDHQRFKDTYFSQFQGKYFTGDGCKRDKDGYYWITGRVDDCINVSGHLLGTAEIESAFVEHTLVSEAAVVGYPHEIKGQGIYAYVTTNTGVEVSEDLKKELTLWIRKKIGPIATPDKIQFSSGLPKTRSGKIMRRILRKIASKEEEQLGDTSTLADPGVVQSLIDGSKNI